MVVNKTKVKVEMISIYFLSERANHLMWPKTLFI